MAADQHMTPNATGVPCEAVIIPEGVIVPDSMGSAVRWTLGNLDQAFDQACDEAFRTCNHLLSEFERCVGPSEENGEIGSKEPIRARFRCCDGPIQDSGS